MNSPFNSIVEKLCAEFDLENVAPKGSARQSSTSKWSKKDDAQRPLKDIKGQDFLFHTEREINPWWELQFEKPSNIAVIIIENRRRKNFQNLSRNIVVEVVSGGRSETVYAGCAKFGTIEEGIPLILPLYLEHPSEKMRITLKNQGYLHLNSIHVLCEKSSPLTESLDRLFIMRRNDGFGERLKALMNVIFLSNRLGGQFKFVWEKMPASMAVDHSVLPAEETFSRKFNSENRISASHYNKLRMKPLVKESANIAKGLPTSSSVDAILVTQGSLKNQAPALIEKLDTSVGLQTAFDTIEFSDELELARRKAQSFLLSDKSVALHLRAGDIVYGRYRCMDRYTSKVVPYPIAFDIIEKAKSANNDVIVFGQDKDLCNLLKKKYDIKLADSIGEASNFNESQKALFEITLMSRTQKIFAGSSGFAVAASRISNAPLVDPYLEYGHEEAIRIIESHLSDNSASEVSKLQVSFASWAGLFLMNRTDPTKRGWELINMASQNDEQNPFYRLVKASWHYQERRDALAEEELRKAIVGPNATGWSMMQMLSTVHPDGTTTPQKWLRPIEMAAERNLCAAIFVTSISLKALGHLNKANELSKKLLSHNRASSEMKNLIQEAFS